MVVQEPTLNYSQLGINTGIVGGTGGVPVPYNSLDGGGKKKYRKKRKYSKKKKKKRNSYVKKKRNNSKKRKTKKRKTLKSFRRSLSL